MNKLKIKRFLILTLVIIAVFYSCTPPFELFILNKSEKTYRIEIKMENSRYNLNEDFKSNYVDLKFKYADSILEINKKTHLFLEDELLAKIKNDSTFLIDIPKNSTLKIGRGIYYIQNIHSITINDSISYNHKEFSSLYKKAKGWNNYFFELE